MRLIAPLQRSLTAKLLLAFATVIVVGISIVAIIANQQTSTEFDQYVATSRQEAARQLAQSVAQTYSRTGSWDATATAFSTQATGPYGRVVIASPAGMIVMDTAQRWLGRSAASLGLADGTPIVAQGRTVGILYLVSGRGGGPSGAGQGRSVGAHQRLIQAEGAFLDQVNHSLIIAALAAALAALVIGTVLARRIARPLRQLTRAAQRIAEGSYAERIPVSSADEVGRLGHAFNQMAESLAQTEQARRQLVADVAHELRTPLTVLKGTVQAMRDGVLEADEQNLSTVQDEVSTMARLVTDLHDLALGDIGQFSLRRHPLGLRPVLEQTLAAFSIAAAEHQVRLESNIAPSLPPIQGDGDRLHQALRNLLANALRYTPAGGAITLRAWSEETAVVIQVSDTGEGIAPEHLPRIMERFYRADPSRARRSGGSGLGLAIVQQIVRAHGGAITAASDGPGCGATFTMRLPVGQ
jgi:signal transduction histidine kinase